MLQRAGLPLSSVASLALAIAPFIHAQQVGGSLPPWKPGVLEIHQISTGRGNSALFILPDGTTLLVDAGAAGDGVPETDPHPDATRTPGAWIVRYLERHMPAGARSLDYALIKHFHADHMGQPMGTSPADLSGTYKLAGITEVDAGFPIHTLIDRGWPDYAYPAPLTDSATANYRGFIEARAKTGLNVERFKPGSTSQIRLLHYSATYPDFEIRNIIGNGEIWTGSGARTRQLFPPLEGLAAADRPSENMCSNGFRLRFGAFSFFTGGDLPGAADPGFPAWHAIEPAIAPVIGHVDVHVVNQHGSMGEESDPFIAALQSTVIIVPSWAPSHPAPDVLKRIMNSRLPPNPRYIFATDMREAARIVIGQRATQLAAPPGHIVIRVEPGGAHYTVIVLDNRVERDAILAVKGPFVGSSRL
jgi:beta-lactamase superfamily II metal-dependent hydrolase